MGVFRSVPYDYAAQRQRTKPTSVLRVRMSPYDAAEYRDLTTRFSRMRACAAPLIRRINQLRRRYGLHHWGAAARRPRSFPF